MLPASKHIASILTLTLKKKMGKNVWDHKDRRVDPYNIWNKQQCIISNRHSSNEPTIGNNPLIEKKAENINWTKVQQKEKEAQWREVEETSLPFLFLFSLRFWSGRVLVCRLRITFIHPAARQRKRGKSLQGSNICKSLKSPLKLLPNNPDIVLKHMSW